MKDGSFATGDTSQIILAPVSEAEAVKAALAVKRVTGEFFPLVEALGLVDYIGHDTARRHLHRAVVRPASDVWTKEEK